MSTVKTPSKSNKSFTQETQTANFNLSFLKLCRKPSRRSVPRQLKKVPIQRASSSHTQLQLQTHDRKRRIRKRVQRLPLGWLGSCCKTAQRWKQQRRRDSVSDRSGNDKPSCTQTPLKTLWLLHNSNREAPRLPLHVQWKRCLSPQR